MEHIDIPLGERHAPHNWEFTDAAARAAASITDTTLIGCLALQLDSGVYYRLNGVSPVAWVPVSIQYVNGVSPDSEGNVILAGVATSGSYVDLTDKPAIPVTGADIGLGNVDNTSDANKPVSTAQASADTATLNSAKSYANGLVVGLLDDRGNYAASGNAYPAAGGSGASGAILKGDLWTISVAGTLGGNAVTVGDVARALVDAPGQTAANWAITENNLGYVPEPAITTGTASQYRRGDKTWQDLFAQVRAATLTGLSTTTNAVITATDTVLSSLGKLQKQVTGNLTTLTNHTGSAANPHSVTKAQVGLGNVDNTSDITKPISAAQQTALNLKADTSVSTLAGNGLTGGGDLSASRTVTLGTPGTVTSASANVVTSTSHTHALTVTKVDVGLGSVDNTADANKPISTAQQIAFDSKADLSGATFTGPVGLATEAVALTSNNLPTIRPSLLLDFANSKTVDPRIAFTRASSATYFDGMGLLRTAAVDAPLIDYDPVTGECKGILIEESRTNLTTYSRYTGTGWTLSGCTQDGSQSAPANDGVAINPFLASLTAEPHRILRAISSGPAGNTPLAFTVRIAKAASSDVTRVYLRVRSGSSGQAVALDLSGSGATLSAAFALSSPFGTVAPPAITAAAFSQQQEANGMLAVTIVTTSASDTTPLSQWDVSFSNTTTEVAAGTANTHLYIDSVQVEAGAFPTSYIPTTSAQVTRAADIANITGANFSNWYRQDEGTFVLDCTINGTTFASTPVLVANASAGTNLNRVGFYLTSAGTWQGIVTAGGVAQASMTGAQTVGTRIRVGIAYAANDVAVAFTGGTLLTDTAAVMPTGVNQLIIGGSTTTATAGSVTVAGITYYPKRLSDATLQALTA